MIRYMLDTNICIEMIRGRGASILEKLRDCKIGDVGISTITMAELECGVFKSSKPDQNRIALAQFSGPLEILSFDDRAAVTYGKVRGTLERMGKTIGPLDTLIAAHALSIKATIVTNNEREFRRVEGLKVENWMER